MQLDTGCAYSLAPKTFYYQCSSNVPLKPTSVLLSTYTGETLYPLGEAHIKLECAGQEYSLPLIVVPEGSNALFGCNWLQGVKLAWPNLPGLKQINQVLSSVYKTLSSTVSSGLESVLQKSSSLLLGCQTQSESRFHFVGFYIFRVGKSLACHSPAKWWLCAYSLLRVFS